MTLPTPPGCAKRALVAHRGPPGGLAFSGHMDTVPETGWQDDPWSARIADGVLHGLGSTDMKGPVAACIVAALGLPADVPATLLITTDEETTKRGARLIAQRSELARARTACGDPRRRADADDRRCAAIAATSSSPPTATGVQAHSSTGRGRNANWELVPFLVEMRDDP